MGPVFGANPAAAQFLREDGSSSLYHRAALGAEIRYFTSDVAVNTTFDRIGPTADTSAVRRNVDSVDPGIEFFFGIPLEALRDGSAYMSVWAAPSAREVVADDQTYAPGDTALSRFSFTPNLVSGFLGYEQLLYRDGIFSVSGRAYAGVRVSTWELDVRGEAAVPYSYSASGTEFVPAGGVDLSINWEKPFVPEVFGMWQASVYGGVQMQGGYSASASGGTSAAIVSSNIEVGTGTTFYGGLRFIRSF